MAIGAPVYSDDEDAALSDDDGDENDASFGYDPNFTSALAMTPKERASMVPSAGEGVIIGDVGSDGGSLGRGRGRGRSPSTHASTHSAASLGDQDALTVSLQTVSHRRRNVRARRGEIEWVFSPHGSRLAQKLFFFAHWNLTRPG